MARKRKNYTTALTKTTLSSPETELQISGAILQQCFQQAWQQALAHARIVTPMGRSAGTSVTNVTTGKRGRPPKNQQLQGIGV